MFPLQMVQVRRPHGERGAAAPGHKPEHQRLPAVLHGPGGRESLEQQLVTPTAS